jgi:hypothetical protein
MLQIRGSQAADFRQNDQLQWHIPGQFGGLHQAAVGGVARGDGKVLGSSAEVPSQCGPLAEDVVAKLKEFRLGCLMVMGRPHMTSECALDTA